MTENYFTDTFLYRVAVLNCAHCVSAAYCACSPRAVIQQASLLEWRLVAY